MMPATSPRPLRPLGDNPPSAAPLRGQTPTPHTRLTPPYREGHLLDNLSALQPIVSTTSVAAMVWRGLSVVNSGSG
jgi:hypothetical protein